MRIEAEIVAVGKEILLGDVLDTNSHWLCGQLTEMSIAVRRVCQVEDDRDIIAGAVRAAFRRGVDVIVTTGGLGPTGDDMTLEALAQALERDLVDDPLALEWVRKKYEELTAKEYVDSSAMTSTRKKMARLPVGGEPLRNEVGAAPGVLIEYSDCIIVSLPGVPEELKDIFTREVRPVLSALTRGGTYLEWQVTIDCGDESVLAPLLVTVNEKWPEVYVKSRARRFGPDIKFLVTLSAVGDDESEVESLLTSAWRNLRQALTREEIKVLDVIRD
ncbi:MAG: competence/damage-inducible protein A [Anaerolineales bacterium]